MKAGGVVIESLSAQGCIPDPVGQIEQGGIALGGIAAGIAAIRRRIYRLRVSDKHKAGEAKCDEKDAASPGRLVYRISGVFGCIIVCFHFR